MILTIIESPYAGNVSHNIGYLCACLRDSLKRGEACFASHGLYPGAINDNDPEERALGIEAGLLIGDAMYAVGMLFCADEDLDARCEEERLDLAQRHLVAVYVDIGISPGMQMGIDRAKTRHSPIFTRTLGAPWSDLAPSSARLEGT